MNARAVRLAALVVLAATAGLAVVLAGRFGAGQDLAPSPLIGKPAPTIGVTRLDGDAPATVGPVPGRVVVLNFFASWCASCRTEHDDLVATAAAYVDRRVLFMGVAYQDAPTNASAFLDEVGWSSDTIYAYDPGSKAAIAYGVRGIPETFVLAANGTVAARLVGPTDALVLGTILEAVLAGETPGEQVLGETQPGPTG